MTTIIIIKIIKNSIDQMSNRETLEAELNDLLEQLNNLQIQQQRIQERVPIIIGKLANTATNDTVSNSTKTDTGRTPVARRVVKEVKVVQQENVRECFYTELFQPTINDEVHILNPKLWQARTGTIQGFTRDGKIKIYTRN